MTTDFIVAKNKGKWAVLDTKTRTWIFLQKRGKAAAEKYAEKLNKEL